MRSACCTFCGAVDHDDLLDTCPARDELVGLCPVCEHVTAMCPCG